MSVRDYGTSSLGKMLRPHEQRENAMADSGGQTSEVLGVVSQTKITETAPPPPWEVEETFRSGDARSFIDVPDEWALRWKNPRVIDHDGEMRYWTKVDPQDRRVKVKVDAMVQVDNTIRRGGVNGDILCWMHKSWVESANRLRSQRGYELQGQVRDKQEGLTEDFKRGKFGPYLNAEIKHTSNPVNERNAGSI